MADLGPGISFCVQALLHPTLGPQPSVIRGLSKASCEAVGGQWTQDQLQADQWAEDIAHLEPAEEAEPTALPQRIEPTSDWCEVAIRWGISPRLARAIVQMAGRLEFGISIISGYRTPDKQRELADKGRPTAPVGCSTHTWCPATGADLRVDVAAVRAVKARLGAEAVHAGLRWGGGSKVDSGGIPADWNHVDLGPRCV